MKKTIFLFSLVIFSFPLAALGAESYDLLQSLPGIGDSSDLPTLISGLINIVIAIGVLLAVIMLAFGGLQYMMTDAVSSKESAKKTITQAVLGLLLLLGSYLILFIINPSIVTDGTDFLSGSSAPSAYSEQEGGTGDGATPVGSYELTTATITNDRSNAGRSWENENCDADKTREVARSNPDIKTGVTNISNPGECKPPSIIDSFTKTREQISAEGRCSFTITCVKKQ